MRTEKIECDNCHRDLTATGSMPAYRLVLTSQSIPHDSSIINAVLVYPDIEDTKHFCNLGCLHGWIRTKL